MEHLNGHSLEHGLVKGGLKPGTAADALQHQVTDDIEDALNGFNSNADPNQDTGGEG